MTIASTTIDEIRLNYRLAKRAERSRIAIDQHLCSFALVYLTDWTPDGTEFDRDKESKRALRVVNAIRNDKKPPTKDEELFGLMTPMVLGVEPARDTFERERKARRKVVEPLAESLPPWARLENIRGFSSWGLGTIVGEAGDIGSYSGCRKLYKRLGFAPDECYPKGEKKTGRMIPRSTKGRIIGIIYEPLFRAQWAAERGPNGESLTKESEKGQPGNIPAHGIGPYGAVYGHTKARHLASGKTNSHAHNLARRTTIKALLHDVHSAWHEQPLTYANWNY